MKNSFQVLVVTLSVSLIVLMTVVQVNHSSATPTWKSSPQVADGIPMPPPPPKKTQVFKSIVADGIPMPPPPPKKDNAYRFVVVDGIPMPPPPPKKTLSLA